MIYLNKILFLAQLISFSIYPQKALFEPALQPSRHIAEVREKMLNPASTAKQGEQVQHDKLQEDLVNQFNYARNLFTKENYFDAITEFKRLKYFDKDKIYDFEANEYIALSYKEGGKLNEAIQYFTLAEIDVRNEEDLFRIKIQIIRSNILRRTTENALRLLDQLENNSKWNNRINEINYWRGWTYVFADEWEKAAGEFSKISPNHELKDFCEKIDNKKYSVTFAKVASVILPGSGQFYTGNYVSGLISLAWGTLWGYLSVDAFVEDRIFDGLAITNLLWFRFYRGNIQNAEKFAVEKNLQISNESLYFLQHSYKGIKP